LFATVAPEFSVPINTNPEEVPSVHVEPKPDAEIDTLQVSLVSSFNSTVIFTL